MSTFYSSTGKQSGTTRCDHCGHIWLSHYIPGVQCPIRQETNMSKRSEQHDLFRHSTRGPGVAAYDWRSSLDDTTPSAKASMTKTYTADEVTALLNGALLRISRRG
jgi:hypothetical protein